MVSFLGKVTILLLLTAICLEYVSADPVPSADMASPINIFTRKFYIYLGYPTPAQYETLVYSPLSLHVLLTMLHQETSGRAKEVVGEVLGITNDQQLDDYLALLQRIDKSAIPNGTLGDGNAIFLEPVNKIDANFVQKVEKKFSAQQTAINLNDLENVQMMINKWVEANSGQLLHKGLNVINQDKFFEEHKGEAGILGNAFFMKNQWKIPFGSVEQLPFQMQDKHNEVLIGKFLRGNGQYRVITSDPLKAKVLEIPFKGDSMALYCAIGQDFSQTLSKIEYEMAINDNVFDEIVQAFKDVKPEDLSIAVPQFKIENTIDITTSVILSFYYDKPKEGNAIGEYLGRMPNAALNYVLDFCKDGLEVATATQMIFANKVVPTRPHDMKPPSSAPQNKIATEQPGETTAGNEFYLNRPFVHFVYNKETKSVVFVGRLTRPQE